MKKIYTEADEARINEVLKDIQRRIPAGLKQVAVTTQPLSPTIEKVMREALNSDNINPEKKQQIQNILDSGMITRTVPMENARATKMIENFVNREINKAIKDGRLPPKNHIKYLPSMLKIQNEQKTN